MYEYINVLLYARYNNILTTEYTMRTCKACKQLKPYDPTQPTYSKASGFHGAACWSCHLAACRARMQAEASPEYMAHKAEVQRLKTELREARRAESDRKFRVKNAEYLAHLEQVLQRKYGTQGTKDPA